MSSDLVTGVLCLDHPSNISPDTLFKHDFLCTWQKWGF